ncbi:hypothetical protein ACWCPF_41815 [Streptomyces sp. NPDC001858]
MSRAVPPDPPARSPRHSVTQPGGPAEVPFSPPELSSIARRLTWQLRAALRVVALTPSRVRQRSNGSHHVDTQSSTHIALTTWHALERKGLAYRDHTAHPASVVGQRLALTFEGLAVLNHLTGRAYSSTATELRPPAPPPHFTSRPSIPAPRAPRARLR